jgi:hypothetical protein
LLSRLLAAMIVTAAGLSGAMLVLQRASREGAGPLGAVQPVAFCPGCGMSLRYPAGEIVCHRCDRGFFVAERARVKPPHAMAIA